MGMPQPSVHSPAPKLTHATPSHPLEPMLQSRPDPHEEEEPTDGADLRPPEPSHPKVVHHCGHTERGQ